MPDLILAGLSTEQSDAAAAYFEGGSDLCFGKYFARTSRECIACRAPVVVDGAVVLFKDLCAARSLGGGATSALRRLSAREVMERFERGESLASIFREILGDAPPGNLAAAARQLLVDRAFYLKTSLKFDMGEIPRTKQLLEDR